MILLASASPRRHDILLQLLIPHQVIHVPSPDGEDEPQLQGETAEDYVRRTARDKAERAARWRSSRDERAGARTSDDDFILAADTAVILCGDVLGKPQDIEDAARSLARLSGRTHQVHTAVCVVHRGQLYESLSVSAVTFKPLNDDEIARYCATGDPMGKAGAYGIQGPAGAFVTKLSGSYTGVMGLPAHEAVELLTKAGAAL